ncbi:uncharacterized protein [Euphorbia lathyris]|uniref:uncharacterized protein n=1 Tax=Euphorbia lathyris TaxID=212925 RepID=UPI003313DCE4
MAKSLRSKKEKRLRAIRREIVQPLYDQKDVAKLAALEAALAAPKLPVRQPASSSAMDMTATPNTDIDVEMGGENQTKSALKPVGLKLKKKLKLGRKKNGGKGKFKRRHI